MSASIGIAEAASAQASAAMLLARKTACTASMPRFDPGTATVQDKQEYAGCVELMFPQPMSADAILAAKVLFVFALIGMAWGAWLGKQGFGDWGDSIMFAFLGFFLLPLGILFTALVVGGIYWLFT